MLIAGYICFSICRNGLCLDPGDCQSHGPVSNPKDVSVNDMSEGCNLLEP